MKVYRLYRRQRLPISLAQAWDFFSSPINLREITPPFLDFRITYEPLPERMYPGAIVSYTVRPMLGVPIDWVTEITHVDEPHYFVDEQRFGPYRMWHHRHLFKAIPSGVEMEDIVDYVLPFGPLGRMLHGLMIGKQLATIFDYRYQYLEKKYGVYQQPSPAELTTV